MSASGLAPAIRAWVLRTETRSWRRRGRRPGGWRLYWLLAVLWVMCVLVRNWVTDYPVACVLAVGPLLYYWQGVRTGRPWSPLPLGPSVLFWGGWYALAALDGVAGWR